MIEHPFGGQWTHDKLERVRKYLDAYVQIMKGRNYSYAYIDAFAGTGYINRRNVAVDSDSEAQQISLLPEPNEPDAREFIDGSARVALGIEPEFKRYIFIEKNGERLSQLAKVKADFPEQASKIRILHGDANESILELCKKDWSAHRAVLFLDPYGMQVPWSTVEKIAKTQAIDLWYLFPIGVAVNRLLKKNGEISTSNRESLDRIFGETDWFEAFYDLVKINDIFGTTSVRHEKTADFDTIKAYLIRRLKDTFPGVAENPLCLKNSRNAPLYLLCFACSNRYGADVATKIAQHILSPVKPKNNSAQLSLL
ncbi:MAG: three-Cys-motif partner protein TcmP [Phormidesmis sp.]